VVTDRTDVLPARQFSHGCWLLLIAFLLAGPTSGCAGRGEYYSQVDHSLQRGDYERADRIIQSAEPQYGGNSALLYKMDRGMTLHLAGRYETSNAILEQADQDVEAAYTKRIRTEARAFLVNDTELSYNGDAFEQVMINVIKAVNYATEGKWNEAVIEARRIDHRLNLLADQIGDRDGYRDDGFARYLSGVFYEVTGDLNNAFIAYRNAYKAYRQSKAWSKMPLPSSLPADLLRTSDALNFTEEHQEYLRLFPDVPWKSVKESENLAQLVVLSYNGRAPYKDDLFIDLPVSVDALNLALLSKRMNRPGHGPQARAAESSLYGLSGGIVRVALPKLIPQKTQTSFSEITLSGEAGSFTTRSVLVDNLTATAEKALAEQFTSITMKAVARAAVKNALAAGAGYGTSAALGRNNSWGPLLGLLVSVVGRLFAVYSEEADKRSWRTLPDEIQMARIWVPAGTYEVAIQPKRHSGSGLRTETPRTMTLRPGGATLITDRVLQ